MLIGCVDSAAAAGASALYLGPETKEKEMVAGLGTAEPLAPAARRCARLLRDRLWEVEASPTRPLHFPSPAPRERVAERSEAVQVTEAR